MSQTFHLTVASVTERFFDGEAQSATLPGARGEMTILAHHEPLITTLREGIITVRSESGAEQKFPVTGGVIECSNNRAVVLL